MTAEIPITKKTDEKIITKFFFSKKSKKASTKSKGSKICPAGKAWAERTFDTYPSAYANMWASAQGRKGKC